MKLGKMAFVLVLAAACGSDPSAKIALHVDGKLVPVTAAGVFKSTNAASAERVNVAAFRGKETVFQVEMPATPGKFGCTVDGAFVLYSENDTIWTAWTREASDTASCTVDWRTDGGRTIGTLHAFVVPDPARSDAATAGTRTLDVSFDVGDSHIIGN